MSYFKKARNYTKPSVTLDEKIAKANQEYEKTGVDLVEIANSTSGVYYAGIDHPEEPAVQSEVPDSDGFRSRDPSLPAENASDIDPSDPSTWETGGQGMDHLVNPNDLPVTHGDNGVETQSTVKDQPILFTPDLTGFKGLRVDPNGDANDMGKYGGIAYTYNLGVWGRTDGVIGPGNKFVSVLAAFGWPTGPLVDSGSPDYPSDRKMFGFYRYDDNATYGARLRMKELYANGFPPGSWKPVKCWMPFNSYGFGETWTQYTSNPNNIWRAGGDAYVTVNVYDGAGKYNSEETIPPYTTVLFHDGLGKPENVPIVGSLIGILEELFGVGGSAAEELAGGLPYGTPGADDPFDAWDDDLSDDDLKDDSDFNPSEWDWAGTGGQGDDVAWGKPKPKGPPTTKTRGGATDAHAAATGMYPSMTPEIFQDKYGMSYDDYLNLPQAGQSQSSTGNDIGDVALNDGPSTPVRYDSDSGTYMPYMGGGRPGNVRPKGSAAFPQASDWTPSSGVEVASAGDLSGILAGSDGRYFSQNGSGSGSTGDLDLPNYFQNKNVPSNADKNAAIDDAKPSIDYSNFWSWMNSMPDWMSGGSNVPFNPPNNDSSVKDTSTAGAGGSPGQPYTPPVENPNNPWVPAPGKDTKVASNNQTTNTFSQGEIDSLSNAIKGGKELTDTQVDYLRDNGLDDFYQGAMKSTDPVGDLVTLGVSAVAAKGIVAGLQAAFVTQSSKVLNGIVKNADKISKSTGGNAEVAQLFNLGKNKAIDTSIPGVRNAVDVLVRAAKGGAKPNILKDIAVANKGPGNQKALDLVTKAIKKVDPKTGWIMNSYESQGQVLTEKNHLRARREAKRGLVEKKSRKVGDKVMKINIPGPKDHLTVKAIDLLRHYKVSEKDMQHYATVIGQINNWVRKYPKEYAIWKIRYPKNDRRLAELNWKMDQQLRASDKYMDKHFPENQKLFGKLRQKIATNVDITDPRNFKDVKPVITHKQLLKVSKAIEKS